MNEAVRRRRVSPTAQIVLIIAGLLFVAVLGYLVLISPKRTAASELESEITAIEAQIQEYRTKALATPPTAVRSAELFRLAKAMPDEADMASMMLELNRVAADAGIEFESITPLPAVVGTSYQVVPIKLAFEGNYYSLSDFLFRLRSLVRVRDGRLSATGRLFAVESISFAEGKPSFPSLRADLTVNAFVFGTGPPATAAPPLPTGTTTTGTTTTPTSTTPAPSPPAAPGAPSAAGTPAPGASS